MPHNPIVLIEFDFDSLEEAIAAKEAHTAQLAAQGIPFSETTLYRLTDNCRVFLISPYDPELESDHPSGRSAKPRSRRPSLEKRRERSQQVDYR